MPRLLSALIPLTPGVPAILYVAQSELPRTAGVPRFTLDGVTLLIHWPQQADPFAIPLGPAEWADVQAGRAQWGEVDEHGEVQRQLTIQLSPR